MSIKGTAIPVPRGNQEADGLPVRSAVRQVLDDPQQTPPTLRVQSRGSALSCFCTHRAGPTPKECPRLLPRGPWQ